MSKEDSAKNNNIVFMALLALSVGVIAGLGAWVFRVLISFVHNLLFLGKISWSYNANIHTPYNPWGIYIILVPVIGSFFVSYLVKNFAPEAKGHGVPEVIAALKYKNGIIRPVVAIVKSLASAICMGSGGSVGREGPIAQIGSAFGSMVGQTVKMSNLDRCVLVAAGAGGGIAATFNVPFGGTLFALELLLFTINPRSIFLVSISTITATHISKMLLGEYPSFFIPSLNVVKFMVFNRWDLLSFVPFGILVGVISAIFIKSIYISEDIFDRLFKSYYVRHAFGMALVGIIIYLVYENLGHYYVQGIGYATIEDILKSILSNPWILLLLIFLKIIVTSLTLGSGGSGGILAPSLFVGACVGALVGIFFTSFFGIEINIIIFALVGMASMVSATTGAFITSAAMIMEMTADYNYIMLIIVASAMSMITRRLIMQDNIYTMKITKSGEFYAEGFRKAVSSDIEARSIMSRNLRVIIKDNENIYKITKTSVFEENGQIREVFLEDGQKANFILVLERDGILDILQELINKKAQIALVCRRLNATNPKKNIKGFIMKSKIESHKMD